jgi:hypothetical protein
MTIVKKHPPSVVEMARKVAALSEIYWHQDCFPKKYLLADKPWHEALRQFVLCYSFERSGAPDIYREIAWKALELATTSEQPTPKLAEDIWARVESLAVKHENLKLNQDRHPLAIFKGTNGNIPVTVFIISLIAQGYNLELWAKQMLDAGKAEDAHNALNPYFPYGNANIIVHS